MFNVVIVGDCFISRFSFGSCRTRSHRLRTLRGGADLSRALTLIFRRKLEGQISRGFALPNPKSVEDGATVWRKCMPQMFVPLTAPSRSITTKLENSHSRTPPPYAAPEQQQGQYPASTRRANSFLAPGWARGQDPSIRTKIEPAFAGAREDLGALIFQYPRF